MSATAASIERLREEAAGCTRCPLYQGATQVVFGEGAAGGMMLVGEQPGDQEDKRGHPFVGPAGGLLRSLLEEAGIPEDGVFLTNAVKHFKWRPRGTRRIHDKPTWTEVKACPHWLTLELAEVRPGMTELWLDAQAPIWLPRGRDAKYASDSSAVVFTATPSTRTCRSSPGQKKQSDTRGFSASCMPLRLL